MKCVETFKRFRQSRSLVIALVCASLTVDYMLLTAVNPIMPVYLAELRRAKTGNRTQTTTLSAQTSVNQHRNHTTCKHSRHLPKHEALYIGLMFSSKPVMQIISNLAVGPITDRIGFDIPLMLGYIIIIGSSILFALGRSYPVMFVARAIQGIGSGCVSTAGTAWLADIFPNKKERGQAISIGYSGIAFGALVGPTFGSVVYQWAGKDWVFIILAILTAILLILQLTTQDIKVFKRKPEEKGTPIFTLLKDPHIMLVAATMAISCTAVGIRQTAQPIWMMKTMCVTKWQLGVAFLPTSLMYLVSTFGVAFWGHKVARWVLALIGMYFYIMGAVSYPFAKTFVGTIGPSIILGIGVGLVDALVPAMATLVEMRYKPVYGSIYAITDIAFSLSFFIGPLIAGGLMTLIGFRWLMWGIAIVFFAFSPLLCLLKNVVTKDEEAKPLLQTTQQ